MAYKILWYSIPSLLDTSSGAAISNKLILEKLVQRGFEVKVLNAMIADDPKGFVAFEQNIKPQLPQNDGKHYYQFTIDGVEYITLKTHTTNTDQITSAEQGALFNLFLQVLEQFDPDLMVGYSGDVFSCSLRHEAKARGVSVAYALCNGSHLNFAFPDCDFVFTTSKATSDYYKERCGVDIKHVGIFIDPKKVIAVPESRQPKYVTLINPHPTKGVAVFAKLVMAYCAKHPDYKEKGVNFLVVKSRGNYEQIICALHYPDENKTKLIEQGKPNPLAMIDVCEHTTNIAAVYALTKVLVAPSLWHESWGQVVTEANMNGIPVLGTNHGGIPEAMGQVGGIALPPPEHSLQDYLCLPTDEEIEPYVAALEHLLEEDWTERCAEAAQVNDIEKSVDRLIELFTPYLEQGQRNKKVHTTSYYFTEKYMKDPQRLQSPKQLEHEQERTAADALVQAATTATTAPATLQTTNGAQLDPKTAQRLSASGKSPLQGMPIRGVHATSKKNKSKNKRKR